MAKKTNKMHMTPIMSLAMFALFALMIPVFTISNSDSQAETSRAAQVATPSPEPTADVMMEK